MSKSSKLSLIAQIGAVVILTLMGLSQTLRYMQPSIVAMRGWFPLALLVKRLTGGDIALLFAACAQFSLILVIYRMVARSYTKLRGLFVVIAVYCALVLLAWLFVK